MLYLLASGQADSHQKLAALLGLHRNTIGNLLASYASGGLDSLLDLYVASGKPLSLSPEVLASLEQALRQPAGFASYEALRQWLRQNHQIEIKYKTLYTIVRTRFATKLKVPAPLTQKTLKRSQLSKRTVTTNLRLPFREPISAQCRSSVKMKAALGCSPFAGAD